MKTRFFPPRIYFLGALLYSLFFAGIYIRQITMICLLVTFPFLGIAYMAGMAAVQVFDSVSVYPLAAWVAVLLQAYCVAVIIWKNGRKNPDSFPMGGIQDQRGQ